MTRKQRKKLARKGRDSNSDCFSCDQVSSFGRFPAWAHPKGLLYTKSSKEVMIAPLTAVRMAFNVIGVNTNQAPSIDPVGKVSTCNV
jgi:hypothetical protein